MREAIREIVADLPHAVLTATGMLIFLGCVMVVLIILATPVPA